MRMAKHCENGQAVAEFLENHPKVAYVNYCGLPGDKYHALAEKYLQTAPAALSPLVWSAEGMRQAPL